MCVQWEERHGTARKSEASSTTHLQQRKKLHPVNYYINFFKTIFPK
jgi:hypothetical protein